VSKPNLLETFENLIQAWRGVFTQERIFERVRRLSFGMLVSLRLHLTSTAICATGRQFQDWTADYRVSSQSPWEPQALFDPIVKALPALLASPQAPVLAALDDTILRKSGRHIPGVKIMRDPISLPFHVNLCYGLRFTQLSVLVSPLDIPGPARALPVRFDFAPPAMKPKKNAPQDLWQHYREEKKTRTLSMAGLNAMISLRQSLDEHPQTRDRQLLVSGDCSYTNQTVLKGLPPRITYIGRMRKNAKLHLPFVVQAGKSAGIPRRYGPRAPTPEEILKDESILWMKVTVFAAGQQREMTVKVFGPVYWDKAGVSKALLIVVIKPLGYRLRNGSKLLYREPAFLVCTDPHLELRTLVQTYVYRWEIECNHRDEKSLLGVGQGQVRNPQAVRRLPQLQVASYSLLLLASILSTGFQRTAEYLPLPKWRRKPGRPSLVDLLALLREQLIAQGLNPQFYPDDLEGKHPNGSPPPSPPLTAQTLCTVAA
jgi:hypothetical protein